MKRLILFVLVIGFFTLAYGQYFPQLRYQKFFGDSLNQHPSSLCRTLDGCLMIGATTETVSNGDDMLLIKVDTTGKVLWERVFGGSGFDRLRALAPVFDGSVIFSGMSNSFIVHPEKGEEMFQGDFFIGRISATGDLMYLTTVGGLDPDQAFDVSVLPDGTALIAGVSSSGSFDLETDLPMANAWLVRITPEGEKVVSIPYGADRHDIVMGMDICANGDVLLAGFTDSEDPDPGKVRLNGDGWLVRTDPFGNLRWQRLYQGRLEDYFTDVEELPGGRIACIGTFESDELSKQFWAMVLTADGAKLYERIIGNSEEEVFTAMTVCASGGILCSGLSRYNTLETPHIKGGEDVWLIRMDEKLNTVWQKTYGGRDDERGVDVVEYRKGVYFVLAEKTNDFLANGTRTNGRDCWLLRIDEQSCTGALPGIYTSVTNGIADVKTNIKFKPVGNTIPTKVIWDFGDGSTSTEIYPSKSYQKPGVYQVKLTVFMNENCYQTVLLPELLTIW